MSRNPSMTSALTDYIVTVKLTHYIDVRARDKDQAEEKALKEVARTFGPGRKPEVTAVQE